MKLGVSRETINTWASPEYATERRQRDRVRNTLPARKLETRTKALAWEKRHKHETVTYFVKSFGLIKIGSTTNLTRRLYHLGSQSATPVKLLGTCGVPEKVLHDAFAADRHHGEWFKPSQPLLKFIRDNCAKT